MVEFSGKELGRVIRTMKKEFINVFIILISLLFPIHAIRNKFLLCLMGPKKKSTHSTTHRLHIEIFKNYNWGNISKQSSKHNHSVYTDKLHWLIIWTMKNRNNFY